ncbi:hypothetical protein GCM10027342_14700 [Photobacterium alginatilyticum]
MRFIISKGEWNCTAGFSDTSLALNDYLAFIEVDFLRYRALYIDDDCSIKVTIEFHRLYERFLSTV